MRWEGVSHALFSSERLGEWRPGEGSCAGAADDRESGMRWWAGESAAVGGVPAGDATGDDAGLSNASSNISTERERSHIPSDEQPCPHRCVAVAT